MKTANIVIPRHHQSSPKEHWADKEVARAAEEIREGKFSPQQDTESNLDTLGLSVQRGESLKNPMRDTIGEFEAQQDEFEGSQALAQHPRVKEAMARLELELDESRSSQETLEKLAMLWELNRNASAGNRWAGQERWMDPEAEERAKGQIMKTLEWFARLEKAIGPGRVFINRFAVNMRVALLSPRRTPKPMLLLPGQPEQDDKMEQVATLQYPVMTEWMVMRFDEYGVPTEAKYLGWRTALLSMIKLGVITEKEAHKAFPLGTGAASEWYREQLFTMRSERGLVH